MALEANSWPAYLVQNSLSFGKISKETNPNKAQNSVVRSAGGIAIYVCIPVIVITEYVQVQRMSAMLAANTASKVGVERLL